MLVQLVNLDILKWLWHDAEVYSLELLWGNSKVGGYTAHLRCELNPEEDFDALSKLGFRSRTIEVQFRELWQFKSDIAGFNARGECIVDWLLVEPSPLLGSMREHEITPRLPVVHHQIECSGGSVFSIISEEIWLAEYNIQNML